MDDDTEDLKARIQELEDELQQLKDQKKQEYRDSADGDQEIEEVNEQIRDEAENSGMSRRKFMKAIAGGGAALGAAAMIPNAAGLKISSNEGLSYFNQSSNNPSFSVNQSGILDANQIGSKSSPVRKSYTDNLYSVDKYASVILRKNSDAETIVSTPDGEIYRGNDDAKAMNVAAQSEYAGMMYLKGDVVWDIGNEQVTIPDGVTFHMDENGDVFNRLNDEYKHPIIFEGGSVCERLLLNANGQQGVKFSGSGSNDVNWIDVANAGYQKESSGNNRQIAVDLQGFGHNIKHIGHSGGNIGVNIEANDVFIDHVISVNARNGITVKSGSGHIYIGLADIESYRFSGLNLFEVNGIEMPVVNLWLNTNNYNVSPDRAVQLGRFGEISNAVVNINTNRAGTDAVMVWDSIRDSHFDVQITNYDPNGSGVETETGIQFEESPGPDVSFSTHFEQDLATKIGGTPGNDVKIDDVAREAAGASNTPTASNYSIYQMVENVDDNTVWFKDSSGDMRQLL